MTARYTTETNTLAGDIKRKRAPGKLASPKHTLLMREMTKQIRLLLFALLAVSALSACGGGGSGSSSGFGTTAATLPAIVPGESLPLAVPVTITQSGAYMLPDNATSLTTRCTGLITVTIDRPGSASPEVNTCNSPGGSSSQTNVVAGVNNVAYTVAPGGSAQVTAN